VGDEAVALALLCAIRHADDYPAAVRMAAHMPGDSDTVACIAGGIVAARVGLDGIPGAWRERCENAAYISRLAARLAALRGE
jgi:ADP-ribosylglycohydrolase